MTTMTMPNNVHHGRNVKRIREILGIKQDTLASLLGEDWNQQKVSLLEQKEAIENPLLEQVAKVLKVPVDAIKVFNEEAANNFFNTFHDSSNFNYHCTFNPLDKVVELYERLLQAERDKVELLQGKQSKK